MPKPTTKEDLLKAADVQFDKLWSLIDSMPHGEQVMEFSFSDNIGKEAHWSRDKNLRDVLIHLIEWHKLFIDWVNTNQSGIAKPFLPEPYNWKTYGEMNVEFWKKHQGTTLESAKDMFRETHKEVVQIISAFADEQLFTKGCLAWTGGSTLGQYSTSVTSSHYDWAMKKIKAHKKTLSR